MVAPSYQCCRKLLHILVEDHNSVRGSPLVLRLLPRASCLALIGFALCNSDILKVETSVIVM